MNSDIGASVTIDDYTDDILYGGFPEDFVWGAATAAYQVRNIVLKLLSYTLWLSVFIQK